MTEMRTFETGATRNLDNEKLAYSGFLSPVALKKFAEYMHRHRFQADGTVRAADNWQKGIPLSSYMESMWRHFYDVWAHHQGLSVLATEELEEALSGLFFNVQGYIHESFKPGNLQTEPVFGAYDEIAPNTFLYDPFPGTPDFSSMNEEMAKALERNNEPELAEKIRDLPAFVRLGEAGFLESIPDWTEEQIAIYHADIVKIQNLIASGGKYGEVTLEEITQVHLAVDADINRRNLDSAVKFNTANRVARGY